MSRRRRVEQPVAFLLHGYLGAGKTTLARWLEQEHQAVRFTPDEWMTTLFGVDPPEVVFRPAAEHVEHLMRSLWTRCLMLGVNIVLDTGFWSRAERLRTRTLVIQCGGEAVLYRLTCSDEEALRRISRRNDDLRGSLYVAPQTYETLKSRFEPLAPDEAFLDPPYQT